MIKVKVIIGDTSPFCVRVDWCPDYPQAATQPINKKHDG